jgi:hypothetical protein
LKIKLLKDLLFNISIIKIKIINTINKVMMNTIDFNKYLNCSEDLINELLE